MDRLPSPARQPNLPRAGRTLRPSGDAQNRPLLGRQEKRCRPLELRAQSIGNRNRAKVRLDAVGLRNPDQGDARESLVAQSIRCNRRIRLGGLKSFQLIDEPECRQVKVVERSLILRGMEVGHAPRVKALVEVVTETGKPGRRNKEEQEAHDNSLQNVPPSGA